MTRIASTSVSKATGVTTPKVDNLVIAAADTEQSFTFPAKTKSFLIQPRGNSKLRLSYAAGMSGTDFYTIRSGAFYGESGIDADTTTIYVQSPQAGLVVELVSWS